MIALFGGPLRLETPLGLQVGSSADGSFQIIFDDLRFENGSGALAGRIVLFENGIVRFDYGTLMGGDVFAGIESASGTLGLSLCSQLCTSQDLTMFSQDAVEFVPESAN